MRRRFAALLCAGAALAALAGCGGSEDPFAVSSADVVERAPDPRFRLPAGASAQTSIDTVAAGPATLTRSLVLPGRVGFDEDRRATVAAHHAGVVAEVQALLGDEVVEGQLLAVLHSRELARARSAFIEASHVHEFARLSFEREERLWKKRITAEESYLRARSELEHAAIDLRAAGQELQALGLGAAELERLGSVSDPESPHASDGADDPTWEVALNRFERRAPIAGRIVGKAAVLGETVEAETALFEVADLSRVWVDVHVQSADLRELSPGAPVRVVSAALELDAEARITYVDPRVEPETQTALARIVLDNADGRWNPGLHVTVHALVGEQRVPIAVPAVAVHRFLANGDTEARARVFVQLGEDSWEARDVRLGASDAQNCEVLEGLAAGERVASTDGLLLRSVWLGQGGLEE